MSDTKTNNPQVGRQSTGQEQQDPPTPTMDTFQPPAGGGQVGRNRLPKVDTGGHLPSTRDAAREQQSRNAAKQPKGRIGGGQFSGYKPSGSHVKYAQNKVGILPGIDDVLMQIADRAALDVDNDPGLRNKYLEAMVTDVYVNAYSEEKSFEGEIEVDDFKFERTNIREVLQPYVGTHYRRYARAMAPYVVGIMYDNPSFWEIIDKRKQELSLNSREEAVYSFDGADALSQVSRLVAERNATAKALSIAKKREIKYYDVDTTSSLGKSVSDVNAPHRSSV